MFAESIIIHRIIKADFGSRYDNIHFIRVIYKATQAKMIDLVVAIDFQFVSLINSWFQDGEIIQSKTENMKYITAKNIRDSKNIHAVIRHVACNIVLRIREFLYQYFSHRL